MCGIWGVIPGKNTTYDGVKRFVQAAAVAGAVRGTDGVGLMVLPVTGSPQYIKSAFGAADFIFDKDVMKLYSVENAKGTWGIVGHNRAATRGDISDDSAHPFQHDHITLVHNGYISNPETLPKILYSDAKGRVDSDVLTESMAKAGMESTLPRAYGAYALAWHDSRDNVLRITRNTQRPLHFMRTKCGALLFASEGDMLWWLAGRANFGRGPVRELKHDIVLSVFPDGACTAEKAPEVQYSYFRYPYYQGASTPITGSSQRQELQTPLSSKETKKINKALSSFGWEGDTDLTFEVVSSEPWHKTQRKYTGKAWAHDKHPVLPRPAVMFAHSRGKALVQGDKLAVRGVGIRKEIPGGLCAVVRAVQVPSEYPGPNKSKLTLSQWEKAVEGGCVECGHVILPHEATEVHWVMNETAPMCGGCVAEWKKFTEEQDQQRAASLL